MITRHSKPTDFSFKIRGFTLIELLVVIGIIGVLISILLPTLTQVRRKATDTRCAARLRELTTALTLYLNQYRYYPHPPELPAFGGPVPLAMQTGQYDAFAGILKWPKADYTHRVDDLPQLFSCPYRLTIDALLDAYPVDAFGAPWWNTGYSYFGGITSTGSPAAQALAADRITDRRGKRRGVLMADTLIQLKSGDASGGYAYWHINGPHEVDATFMLAREPRNFRGHHRAWTDGSVEWLGRKTFDLNPAQADTQAGYKVGSPASMLYFYF